MVYYESVGFNEQLHEEINKVVVYKRKIKKCIIPGVNNMSKKYVSYKFCFLYYFVFIFYFWLKFKFKRKQIKSSSYGVHKICTEDSYWIYHLVISFLLMFRLLSDSCSIKLKIYLGRVI